MRLARRIGAPSGIHAACGARVVRAAAQVGARVSELAVFSRSTRPGTDGGAQTLDAVSRSAL